MMSLSDVRVGQIWKRKDGRKVKLAAERVIHGLRELRLDPVGGKGRRSWKWDAGIIHDLKFVAND